MGLKMPIAIGLKGCLVRLDWLELEVTIICIKSNKNTAFISVTLKSTVYPVQLSNKIQSFKPYLTGLSLRNSRSALGFDHTHQSLYFVTLIQLKAFLQKQSLFTTDQQSSQFSLSTSIYLEALLYSHQ